MRHTKQYMVPARPRDDLRYMGSAYQSDAKRARTAAGPGDHGSADSKYKTNFPVGAGTFGLVLKASRIMGSDQKDYGTSYYAIKEFKPSKDQELSLTAIREIGLLRELHHENIIKLVEVLVKATDKYSLSIVFEYAEFDLFVCASRPSHLSRSRSRLLFSPHPTDHHQETPRRKDVSARGYGAVQHVADAERAAVHPLQLGHPPRHEALQRHGNGHRLYVSRSGQDRRFAVPSHLSFQPITHHDGPQQTLGLPECSATPRHPSTRTAWS